MENHEWRARLELAIKRSGKSKRSISLASGNGPGYVHSITTEGKDPKIGNLVSVCNALDVDVLYILHGIEATPAQVRLLKIIQDHPDQTDAILSLLEQRVKA